MRNHLTTARTAVALLILLGAVGCGGSAGRGGDEKYPLVEASASATQPARPTGYESDPSASCERELATFHDGSRPARRPIVIPPAPGLRAFAVTERTTRLEWSFRDLPNDCRPLVLRLSVVASGRATPTTRPVDVGRLAGSAEIAYPDFLPAPDVALASAYSRDGHRSRTVGVLIQRGPNVPPDPAEPAPPITAPAGAPVTCRGRATAVDDPAGDVLTYAPGSSPERVRTLGPALAGIDITKATVQIQGRTICATVVFAEPPARDDVELTVTLRDATTPSCCASLRFRRSPRGLEVGYVSVAASGRYELAPVPDAGASLRDDTLVMTGTLPPPSAWQSRSRRLPSAANVGWSVTSGYSPKKYGPYYGDWLPGYDDVAEPVVRHRDGATVIPGAG